jgi:ferredoxin
VTKRLEIVVDRELCEVNGLCVTVAPDVFEVGDDDLLRVLDPQPSAAKLSQLETAVRRCPKGALTIKS